MWRWKEDSFEPATIVSRPGYHVGFDVYVHKFIDEPPVTAPPPDDPAARPKFSRIEPGEWSRHVCGLPRGPDGSAGGLMSPRIREALADGKMLRFEFHATVFETSNPPQSRWRPEAGNYRPLREYKIVETWPESR